MTDGYDCYQNALAERINGILKEEFLIVKPSNIHQARKMIAQAVKLYNDRRPHLALNYLTPNIIHEQKILASITWQGLYLFFNYCQPILGRLSFLSLGSRLLL